MTAGDLAELLHCPCTVGTPYFVVAPDCLVHLTTICVNNMCKAVHYVGDKRTIKYRNKEEALNCRFRNNVMVTTSI